MKEEKQVSSQGVVSYAAPRADIFNPKSLLGQITASQKVASSGSNTTLNTTGMTVLAHPLNMPKAIELKDISSHHSSCIQAKKNCTVGLGFLSNEDIQAAGNAQEGEEQAAVAASLLTGAPYIKSEADTALDPLTLFGFNQALMDAVEDFEDTGNGYLEVARDKSGNIRYIGHLPAKYVHCVVQSKKLYYRVRTNENGNVDRYFSRFGKVHKDWLFSEGPYKGTTATKKEDISEVIHFARPTNRCQYYGYPDWLSAAVDVDLLKKSKQYKADFLHNRGVLDFVLSVVGGVVDEPVWEQVKAAVKGTSGMGNNWKNIAMNIANPEAKVQVDKLAMDSKTEDQFAKDCETFAQNIVSAHRVPPLLANILIPGKLGASNEYMNSLLSFQLLVIGPDQQVIQKTLAGTLGNDAENGKLKLTDDNFRLRTITSQINLEGLNTLGKMREEAVSSDRDLEEGTKD